MPSLEGGSLTPRQFDFNAVIEHNGSEESGKKAWLVVWHAVEGSQLTRVGVARC